MAKKREDGPLLKEARANKANYNKVFDRLSKTVIGILIVLVILVTIGTIVAIWMEVFEPRTMFKAVAVDIILVWIGVLFRYYAWIIYFFNVNEGLTDEDWADIYDRRAEGEVMDLTQIKNPHGDRTLGLPDGTIRGTLALSLAVGALALLIASFGMDSSLPTNQLFVDVFDFFKTAFLMMVAFYFGNKSLQYINQMNPVKWAPKQSAAQGATSGSNEESGIAEPTLPPSNVLNSGLKQQSNQPGASAPDVATPEEAEEDIPGPKAKD